MAGDGALVPLGLCLLGLIVLIGGAEVLVRGGTALAQRFHIPPVIIGLTVVAVGTSAPELAVGIDASLKGNGALAVGNIAGTNTVNILLVLGISALMRPLQLQRSTLRFDLPAMLLAAAAFLVLSLDGELGRTDGLVLVAMGLVYSSLLIRQGLRHRAETRAQLNESRLKDIEGVERNSLLSGPLRDVAMLAGGIVVVVVGADWLVAGGVRLAEIWGVSDAFIGLTIVAIGTSAPELVTTVVSTMRNERDIAIGNLLGSSTYNIAFIMGVTSLIPSEGAPVPDDLLMIDIPVMAAAVVACVPAFLLGKHMSRLEGGLFVGAYVIYLAYLLIVRT